MLETSQIVFNKHIRPLNPNVVNLCSNIAYADFRLKNELEFLFSFLVLFPLDVSSELVFESDRAPIPY